MKETAPQTCGREIWPKAESQIHNVGSAQRSGADCLKEKVGQSVWFRVKEHLRGSSKARCKTRVVPRNFVIPSLMIVIIIRDFFVALIGEKDVLPWNL